MGMMNERKLSANSSLKHFIIAVSSKRNHKEAVMLHVLLSTFVCKLHAD